MTTGIDLRSIGVNLTPHQTTERQATPPIIQLESTDYSELLRKMAGVNTLSLTCTLACITCDFIFTLIILGMGGSNRSACPMEPRIPTYLIVQGSVNLISLCFSISACIIHRSKKDKNMFGFYYVHGSAIIIILLQLFNLIWLIIGSIWIFNIFNSVQYTDSSQSTFCKGSLYQFAVVSLILQYVFPFVLCCCKNIPFYF